MFELVSKIGDFIAALFDVVMMLVDGLTKFIEYLGEVTVIIPGYLRLWPPVLVSAVLSIVAIAVVYKIIGRST